MIVIGIDPGLDGAIAILCPETMKLERILDVPTMGTKPRIVNVLGLYSQMKEAVRVYGPVMCWLEEAWARPKQGVSTSFKCGRTIGNIEAVIICVGWPIRTVTPAKWKLHFGLAAKGKTKHDSRARATRLFPASAEQFSRAKDDGRAEAALIALYGAEQSRMMAKEDAQEQVNT